MPLSGTFGTGTAGAVGDGGSYNGFAFGIVRGLQRVDVMTVAGLDDLPAIRASDVAAPQSDGSYPGLDLVDERVVTLGLQLVGPDPDTYRTLLDQFRTAFLPSRQGELPLYVYDSTRLVNARVDKRAAVRDPTWPQAFGDVTVELVATDPRIYDAMQQSVSVPVQVAPSGGLVFPLTFPLTFGGGPVGTTGIFTATNAGDWPAPWQAHIIGPVDNPRIEHTGLGKTLELGMSLAVGDYLDIDSSDRSIVLNGTASRRGALTAASSWFDLQPGSNQLRYAANTIAVGSTATFTFRSAWL